MAATGNGFILYSGENIRSRFQKQFKEDMADNFVCVRWGLCHLKRCFSDFRVGTTAAGNMMMATGRGPPLQPVSQTSWWPKLTSPWTR